LGQVQPGREMPLGTRYDNDAGGFADRAEKGVERGNEIIVERVALGRPIQSDMGDGVPMGNPQNIGMRHVLSFHTTKAGGAGRQVRPDQPAGRVRTSSGSGAERMAPLESRLTQTRFSMASMARSLPRSTWWRREKLERPSSVISLLMSITSPNWEGMKNFAP